VQIGFQEKKKQKANGAWLIEL